MQTPTHKPKKATKSKLVYSEMKTMKSLGEYIKNERKGQALSLEQLSIKAFGSEHQKKAISLIERAKLDEVRFITIVKIFKGLNIDLGF
mgnify:FL=1